MFFKYMDNTIAVLKAMRKDSLSASMMMRMENLPDSNVALPDSIIALPRRYTKEQLKEIIREVCSDWVTAEVIAARIGRNVNYVKNHVLPKFVDVIEKMYNVPHHPRQKYRAKQKETDL